MVLDQTVPQLLPVRGQGIVPVDQLVRGEDDRRPRVPREDVLRPGVPLCRQPPVQRQHHPLAPGRPEQVVGVVAVRGGAPEGRPAPQALRPEHVQVRRRTALVVRRRPHVVVAGQDAVADAPPVEDPERLADGGAFLLGTVLGEVAEVGEEDDVVVLAVLQQIPQGRLDGSGVDARPVEEVLGVGHHGEREAAAVGVGPAASGSATPAVAAAPSSAVALRKLRRPAPACAASPWLWSCDVHTCAP